MNRGKPLAFLLLLLFSLALMSCRFWFTPEMNPFYQTVLATHPNHPTALYLQGEQLFEQGHFEKSARFFEKLAAACPDHERGWLALGKCRLELTDGAGALSAFRKALALETSVDAKLGVASAHLILGDLDLAQEELQAVYAVFGESAPYRRLKGDLAFIREQPETAMAHYSRSLELNPNQPQLKARLHALRRYIRPYR